MKFGISGGKYFAYLQGSLFEDLSNTSNVAMQQLMDIIKQHLNHIFRTGSLNSICSGPGALPNKSGTCSNASGVFFCIELASGNG